MTDRFQVIVLTIFMIVLTAVLWAVFSAAVQCDAVNGTLGRGLVWLECIR